jgi:hypothetical protein
MDKKINATKIGKICGGLVALALGTTILLKDNVHFGSVTLPNDAKGNQYAIGFYPQISVSGKSIEGNHYSIGICAGINEYRKDSIHNGNSFAIGFLGAANLYATNTIHNGNSTAMGLFTVENKYEVNSSHKGNSKSFGILEGRTTYATNAIHLGYSITKGAQSLDKEGLHFLGNTILE